MQRSNVFNARGLRATRVMPPVCDDNPRRYPRTIEQAFPEAEGARVALHGPYSLPLSPSGVLSRAAARLARLLCGGRP